MYKYIKTVLLKVEVNTQMRRDKKMSYSNDIFTGLFFISSLKISVSLLRIQMDRLKYFDRDDLQLCFPILQREGNNYENQ